MADEIAQVVDLEYKGIYYLLKGTKAMIAAMVSGVKSLHEWNHQKWLNKPGSCSWQKIQEASEGMAPILEFPKEMFEPNTVVGGLSGISLKGSDICTDDGCLHLVCSYELRSPVTGLGLPGIKGSSEIVYRYFTGTAADSLLEESEQETEPEEETVYMTETGTVYHVRLTCPSLKLHILTTTPGEVNGQRNEYGGKYYPCEKCASGETPEVIYITTDGDRYHYRLDCSGLKRTITEIKKSEADGLRPCKRCGEKGD